MYKKLFASGHWADILAFVFASIGGFLLVASTQATTFSTSDEAESGTVEGNAAIVTAGDASDGKAVGFGALVCGSLPVGADNAQIGFNFFVSRGFTTEQSAGIIGNFMQESHMDPRAVQSGGPGRGIAQWSLNDRWANLQDWAGSRDIWDLQTQLDFVIYELQTTEKATVPAVVATDTPEDAAYAFQIKYERAGTPNDDARTKYANEAFDEYAATAPPIGCAGDITKNP